MQIPDLPSLKKLKVLELKNWCDGYGIRKQGLKNDLINRLDAARSSRPSNKVEFELSSRSGNKLNVVLSDPEKDDECPLTLDSISNDALDFLPSGSSFLEGSPSYKKMCLPCGHSFGALNLIYHFLKNNMQCPCCRAGPTDRAAVSSLPKHLRTVLTRHIRGVEAQEYASQSFDDWRAMVESAWGSIHGGVDESELSDEDFSDLEGSGDEEEDDEDDDDDDDDDIDDADESDDGSGDGSGEDESSLDSDGGDEGNHDVRAMLHHQMMILATGRVLGLI